MFLPRLRNNNYSMDRYFDDFFSFPSMFDRSQTMMETNIKELDHEYQLDIALPGFEKKDVKLELKKGYLTILAEHQDSQDEKDSNGRYIRQEYTYNNCSRSFYVGESVAEEDIHATLNEGILKIAIPKKEIEAKKKFIDIE